MQEPDIPWHLHSCRISEDTCCDKRNDIFFSSPQANWLVRREKDGRKTYRSAGLVVVQIHLLAQISATLPRVDEFAGELEPVADVVRTATPFPIPRAGWWPRLVGIVAGARLDAALAARSRDAVSHGGARDGVDEGGLSTTCNDATPLMSVESIPPIRFLGCSAARPPIEPEARRWREESRCRSSGRNFCDGGRERGRRAVTSGNVSILGRSRGLPARARFTPHRCGRNPRRRGRGKRTRHGLPARDRDGDERLERERDEEEGREREKKKGNATLTLSGLTREAPRPYLHKAQVPGGTFAASRPRHRELPPIRGVVSPIATFLAAQITPSYRAILRRAVSIRERGKEHTPDGKDAQGWPDRSICG